MNREEMTTEACEIIKEIEAYSPETGKTLNRAFVEMTGLSCASNVEEEKKPVLKNAGNVLAEEVESAKSNLTNLERLNELAVGASNLRCGG